MTPATPLAFIGLGIMGLPMAGHLRAAGHPITVHTRTRSKAAALLERGATWADSPHDAARSADVVFFCLPDTPDVEMVIRDVLPALRAGQIIVDHSTISPSATRAIAEHVAQKGAQFLDAPISGGDVGARNATLSIMVGGEKSPFDSVEPLLKLMGKTIIHTGASGTGQLTKLTNQILVSITNLAVCEALNFATRNGLDPQKTLAAIGGGAGASWQLANLGPRMLVEDFAPGFMVDLMLKDLRLVDQAEQEAGLKLPATELVHGLFRKLLEMRHGRSGTQALYAAVREAANI
jgi:3-hydroxyisobutyrate dehydrogenase